MFSLPVAVLSMVLLSACGGGGGETNPGQPPPTDTVTGTVTFKGAPLPGAQVLLYTCNENYFAQTATTDANGNYSFAGLCTSADVPSEWLFWVMKDGFGFSPSVGGGANAKVVRAGCNNFLLGYNTDGVGLNVTGIDYISVANVSLSGADFTACDGSQPLVHLAQTGQVTSMVPGDDAAKLAGVPWPATRFTDNQDGTVTDHLTGLIWLKNAGTFSPATWFSALTEVSQLANGSNGLSDGSKAGDWRLPNINELESLVDVSQSQPALPAVNPFANVPTGPSAIYWSSTPYYGASNGNSNAWSINFSDGSYLDGETTVMASSVNGVWAVKGAGGGAVQLQATGYLESVAAGDDGSLQTGVRFPYPRFLPNSNGTVTDTLTGLVWLKQANAICLPWAGAVAAVNGLASGQYGLTDGSGAGDWRMPSRNEMQSLSDRMQAPIADFFDNTFYYANGTLYQPAPFTPNTFISGQFYWTSTTYAPDPTQAWTVYSCDFGVYDMPKANPGYTLAVR
jgi:hypothetical protein